MTTSRGKYIIVAIIMLVIAAINLASVFSVIEAPNAPPVPADEAPNVEAPVEAELIRGVGGLTSPAGLGVLFTTLGLGVTAVGLLTRRPWEMGAMFFLGADIFFKLLNVISQLTILAFSNLNIILGIALMLIESALILTLFYLWRDRQQESPAPARREVERANF